MKIGKKFWVTLFAFCLIAIAGLSIGIILTKKDDDAIGEIDVSDLSEDVVSCLVEAEDSDCGELKNKLENIIDSPKGEYGYDFVLASVYLSDILAKEDDYGAAINVLNEALTKELSDENRYYVLGALFNIYSDIDDKENEIKTLRELIDLPDSMELEQESWPYVKQVFIERLNEIEDNYEN